MHDLISILVFLLLFFFTPFTFNHNKGRVIPGSMRGVIIEPEQKERRVCDVVLALCKAVVMTSCPFVSISLWLF